MRKRLFALLVGLIIIIGMLPQSFVFAATTTNKLVIIGDSISQTYSSGNRQGWGYYLNDYFDSSKMTVDNRAVSGYNSNIYLYGTTREGYPSEPVWPGIKDTLNRGDYVMIGLCFNEWNDIDGTKSETAYKANIKTFIDDCKDKGANPILLTPTVQMYETAHTPFNTYGSGDKNVIQWVKDLSSSEGVPYLDLNAVMFDKLSGMNGDEAYSLYYVDTMHLKPAGASMVAELIIDLLSDSDCELKNSLKEPSITETVSYNGAGFWSTNAKLGTLPAGSTVELAFDGSATDEIRYTLDGSTPTSESKKYSSRIELPSNKVIRLRAAAFNSSGVKVSDYFDKFYAVGTPNDVAKNPANVSETPAAGNSKRSASSAFNNVLDFSNYDNSVWAYTKDRSTVEVTYSSPITADCLNTFVMVTANSTGSFLGTSGVANSVKEINLKMNVSYWNGTEYVSASDGWKDLTIPVGHQGYVADYVGYVSFPMLALNEFTSDKVKFEVEKAGSNFVNNIIEIQLFETEKITHAVSITASTNGPELSKENIYKGTVPAGTTVTLAQDGASSNKIRYTMDGSMPAADSKEYTAPIALPENKVIKLRAAVFNTAGDKVSDVDIDKVYVIGTPKDVARQDNAEKISSTESNMVNLFNGYVGGEPQSMGEVFLDYTNGGAKTATVEYDSAITADSLVVQIVTQTGSQRAFPWVNGAGNETRVSTKDIELNVDISYWDELKNEFVSATGGTKKIVIPTGSVGYVLSSGTWVMVSFPVEELESFTSNKVQFTISDPVHISYIQEMQLFQSGCVMVDMEEPTTGYIPVIKGSNYYSEPVTVTVYAAGYNEETDGISMLNEVEIYSWTLMPGDENVIFSEITNAPSGDYIKYFVWTGGSDHSMIPLTEACRIDY